VDEFFSRVRVWGALQGGVAKLLDDGAASLLQQRNSQPSAAKNQQLKCEILETNAQHCWSTLCSNKHHDVIDMFLLLVCCSNNEVTRACHRSKW
jgi:hypothetical protein